MNGTVAASRVSIVSSWSIGPLRSLVHVRVSIGMDLCFQCAPFGVRSSFPAFWLLSRDWRLEERVDSSTLIFLGNFCVFPIFSFWRL